MKNPFKSKFWQSMLTWCKKKMTAIHTFCQPAINLFWKIAAPVVSFAQAYTATTTVIAIAAFIGVGISLTPVGIGILAISVGIVIAILEKHYNDQRKKQAEKLMKHLTCLETQVSLLEKEFCEKEAKQGLEYKSQLDELKQEIVILKQQVNPPVNFSPSPTSATMPPSAQDTKTSATHVPLTRRIASLFSRESSRLPK